MACRDWASRGWMAGKYRIIMFPVSFTQFPTHIHIHIHPVHGYTYTSLPLHSPTGYRSNAPVMMNGTMGTWSCSHMWNVPFLKDSSCPVVDRVPNTQTTVSNQLILMLVYSIQYTESITFRSHHNAGLVVAAALAGEDGLRGPLERTDGPLPVIAVHRHSAHCETNPAEERDDE